jgi:tRNA pseudouridine38-40 synthase
MTAIAIILSYDGTEFSGFARQQNARTVQAELEQALAILAKTPIETVCAGRTDAGVHAAAQVVSCLVPDMLIDDPSSFVRSLNALTPHDMVIRTVEKKPDSFSARFDATSRIYRYRIAQADPPPLFMAPFAWHVVDRLDRDAMYEAAQCLIGEHDFSSFCVTQSARDLETQGLSTHREIFRIELDNTMVMGEQMLDIVIQGNAFLHSMVRVIVGTLVEVGRGKRDPRWMRDVLEARDRTSAGQTAPAQGLILEHVAYGDETS